MDYLKSWIPMLLNEGGLVVQKICRRFLIRTQ